MSRASRPPPDSGGPFASRDTIIEFTRVGGQIRAAAVDVATGAEAVVFGPVSAAQADLERLALNKLRYVMEGRPGDAAHPRPGKLV